MRSLLAVLVFASSRILAQSPEAIELVKQGIAFHDQGKYEEAIQKYSEALKLDPTSGLIHYEMSFSYHAAKNYEKALYHADEAMKSSDAKIALQAAIVKGSVLDDRGDTKESIDFYRKVLKDYPNEYLLLFNYAVSCGRAGLMDEAEDALEKALENNFNHPSSHLKLAYIKLDKGEKVKAVYGLYFFLMLENRTPRAKDALAKLQQLLDSSAEVTSDSTSKDGTKHVNMNLNIVLTDTEDTSMGAAEIGLAAIAATSLETDKNATPTDRFVNNTKHLFSMMGELKENKSKEKKKGKKKQEASPAVNLFWDWYVPFFYDLSKTDHVEAFAHHILTAGQSDENAKWISDHPDKMEYFYLWVKNH